VPSIAFDSRGIGERLDPISRRRVRCSACGGMAARNPGPPVFESALEDGLAGVAFVIANDKAPIAVVKADGISQTSSRNSFALLGRAPGAQIRFPSPERAGR
jgi:hypothetical protein